LARHGYKLGLYESRSDSRKTSVYEGKSINIALSDRGWTSLDKIGISAEAKNKAIPMYHRAIHGVDGELSSLPYGKEGDAIWSVSRGGINEQLLDIADDEANITTHFEHRLVDVDFESATTTFKVENEDDLVVESDFFMLIALPNPDGTFTCTLFLNYSGDPSFESLRERPKVEAFFKSNFADAMEYLEDPVDVFPVDVFMAKTAAPLFLVHVFPWSFNKKIGLIGDAAHAIVPFYGQGMNCGFEDCAELDALITRFDHDWDQIFPAYERARKPNGDAIAELSKRNFVEMSDEFPASQKDRGEIQQSFSGIVDATLLDGDILAGCSVCGSVENRR